MINHLAIALALRTYASTLSVATTGVTVLAATSTGYTRASGSFIDDGFCVGHEVLPMGFIDTTPGVVLNVTDSTLTISGGRTADAETAGRSLTVGLPALQSYENVAFTPIAGRPYVTHEYLPGPMSQVTIGANGELEADPLYILTLYGVENMGASALYTTADALLTHFAPRTAIALANGDVVRVRTQPAPTRGQLQHLDTGWSVIQLTIPLQLRTPNSI